MNVDNAQPLIMSERDARIAHFCKNPECANLVIAKRPFCSPQCENESKE